MQSEHRVSFFPVLQTFGFKFSFPITPGALGPYGKEKINPNSQLQMFTWRGGARRGSQRRADLLIGQA